MNQSALSQLKKELLKPETDCHEVLLVFYTDTNPILWQMLLKYPCNSVYFVKKSDSNREILDSIFNVFTRTDNNSQLPPHILRLTVSRNSTSFVQELIDQTNTIPKEENETIQEFIDVFIERLKDYIIKL